MATVVIGGLDPSLSNLGMVKATLDLDTGFLSDVVIKLVETNYITKDKKTVRKNSIDLDRARLLHNEMHSFMADCQVIAAELPVGSQSARSMASYGICIGLLGSITKPLIQVTPTEVKLAAVGDKQATKQQMIEWATSQHPNAGWFTRNSKGTISYTKKNEHPADALGAIFASAKTSEFLSMRAVLNG